MVPKITYLKSLIMNQRISSIICGSYGQFMGKHVFENMARS
jgi:hypothetical protein